MNKLEIVLFNIHYIAEKLGDNPSKADLIRYQKELYKECRKLEVIITSYIKSEKKGGK